MTGIPMRRLGDSNSRVVRWLAWLRSPAGQALQGAWLMLLSLIVAVAVVVYVMDAREAGNQAQASCERTSIIAPYLAEDFERRDVLPHSGDDRVPDGDVQAFFEQTIPPSCE